MKMAIPGRWDYEADVVVLGFGGAGATAAASLAEKGVSVLVLEKESFGGGDANTLAFAPLILTVLDEAKALEYLRWCTAGRTEDEVLLANMEALKEVPEYVRKLKLPLREEPFKILPYGEYPNAPGYGGLGQIMMLRDVPGGPAFFNAQAQLAKEMGAKVMYNTPAIQLIQDPDTNTVIGVYAKRNNREIIAVKARKATIIATGGFAFNREMVKQYISPAPILWMGARSITGDGIIMAQAVGAQLWHMDGMCGPMYWAIEVDNHVYATWEVFVPDAAFYKVASFIWVNKYGKRFDSEARKTIEINDFHRMRLREKWFAFDPMGTAETKNIPAFQIFDEKARTAQGALVRILNPRTPPWSKGGVEEIKKGWILKADTIEELAKKCKFNAIDGVTRAGNIPPNALRETVERWNANCLAGEDSDFGRDAGLVPIDTPPYYAMGPMFPACTSTFGGPKHDGKQRVLDAYDEPIPRLYAIGDCGSLNAYMYGFWGGTHMLTSGLIAANNAINEPPGT